MHITGSLDNRTIASPKAVDRRFMLALILVTLFAVLLRVYQLDSHSIWYDEAATVNNLKVIVHPPQDDPLGPFAFVKRERVPPLYFLLLAPLYWISSSEGVLRLASAVIGAATIPLMYLLGSLLSNKRTGVIAALLLAASPFHLYYSQELRPYSLFLFFALLAFVSFLLALKEGRDRYFFITTAAVVLGFYTHTYMLIVLFLLDLLFLLLWKQSRQHLFRWFLNHVMMAVLCIPEIVILLYHIGRGNTNLFDLPPGLRSLAGTIYLFTVGRFFFPTGINIIAIAAQGMLWGGGLLAGGWLLWKGRDSSEGRISLRFVLAALMIYVMVFVVSMLVFPLFDEARVHYLIFLLPVYIFVASLGFASIKQPSLRIAVTGAAVLLSLVSSLPYFFQWDQVGRGSFRAAAGYLQEHMMPGDNVYHTSNLTTYPLEYYMDGPEAQILIDADHGPAIDQADAFWLVVFKPSSAVKYLQNTAGPSQAEAACVKALPAEGGLAVTQLAEFPGKNNLYICRYQRLNP